MPLKNPTERSVYLFMWRLKNKDKLKEYARRHAMKMTPERAAERTKSAALSHRRSMRRHRRILASALGNKCQRCGFDDERAFQFHHRDKGGNKHREEAGASSAYYIKMLSQSLADPGSIQLLCANCHAIEHWIPDDAQMVAGRVSKKGILKKSVASIRSRHSGGESISSIARSFGVTRKAVARSIRR